MVSRETVVIIPTGSLEQHGPHLPLFTDSLLATSVAEAVESQLPQHVLLTPTLWLGASGHHLAFPGTLSASMDSYIGSLRDVVKSLEPHGFRKFYVINGHGGNSEPNGIAMRQLKAEFPTLTLGHSGYFEYAKVATVGILEGPSKEIRHACEAEVSLMMYLHPTLVRADKLRNDGLVSEPFIPGLIHHFDEQTEEGSHGFATFATPEKGKLIFEHAVEGLTKAMKALATGYVLRSL